MFFYHYANTFSSLRVAKFLHKGGNKYSLHELEKNATATPKMATLLTTLAFSAEVKLLYTLAT